MSYVDQVLTDGERVVTRRRTHWIVLVKPVALMLLALWAAAEAPGEDWLSGALPGEVAAAVEAVVGATPGPTDGAGLPQGAGGIDPFGGIGEAMGLPPGLSEALKLGAAGAFFASALWLLVRSVVYRMTTEFAVTDRRVLIKTGFVARYAYEVSLRRVEGVHVSQTVLGRMLGYGTVMVNGVGGWALPFRLIPDPVAFRQHLAEAVGRAEGGTE